jgi:hypothetical protein
MPFSRRHTNPNTNSTRGGDFAVRRASPEKAMDFLKKIGKGTGGWSADNGLGIDEGSEATRHSRTLHKVSEAYAACTDDTGIIDDMTEAFPTTRCGTGWGTFTYVVVFVGNASDVVCTHPISYVLYVLSNAAIKSWEESPRAR